MSIMATPGLVEPIPIFGTKVIPAVPVPLVTVTVVLFETFLSTCVAYPLVTPFSCILMFDVVFVSALILSCRCLYVCGTDENTTFVAVVGVADAMLSYEVLGVGVTLLLAAEYGPLPTVFSPRIWNV